MISYDECWTFNIYIVLLEGYDLNVNIFKNCPNKFKIGKKKSPEYL